MNFLKFNTKRILRILIKLNYYNIIIFYYNIFIYYNTILFRKLSAQLNTLSMNARVEKYYGRPK